MLAPNNADEIEPESGLIHATDDEIRAALVEADPAILRAVLLQLAPDEQITGIKPAGAVDAAADRVGLPWIEDEADIQLIREKMLTLLEEYRDGVREPPAAPSSGQFRTVLEGLFGHEVLEDDVPFWREEFGDAPLPRSVDMTNVPQQRLADIRVLVVGAGMNGLAAAAYLKAAGVQFIVVDKNDRVGGTWASNVYPGARVDVASRAYSYTFEPTYPWKHVYATQPELLDYFDHCVERHDLSSHLRLDTQVLAARWSEDRGQWEVDLDASGSSETIRVDVIVSAVGLFNQPLRPALPGLADFAGQTLHTAQWDPDVVTAGKRIAVIGTGSSGIQVVPGLSESAAQLTVFQRAGAWIAHVPDYTDTVGEGLQWTLDHCPYYVNWARLAQVHAIGDTRARMLDVDPEWDDSETVSELNWRLRQTLLAYVKSKLGDRPELVAACIPDYPPLAKRLPKDNGWYDAITQEHVTLVRSPIESVTEAGIRTADGVERSFDLIVLATGFDANNYLGTMQLEGRGGLTLHDVWAKDGARAFLGMLIPGFPNLFCLYGPNTNGKSGSPCSWGEMQVRYMLLCLKHLMQRGTRSLEIRTDVFEAFNRYLDERLSGLIWMDQRQKSYYRNEFNRVATNGAWLNHEYWAWTQTPNWDHFVER